MLWHVPAFNSLQKFKYPTMLNTRILEIYEDRITKIFPEFHDQTLNCPTAVMAHIPRIKVANMSLVQSRAHKDIGSLITFEYIFVYYPI